MKGIVVALVAMFLVASVPGIASEMPGPAAEPAVDDWDRMVMQHGLPRVAPPGAAAPADGPIPPGTQLWGGGVHNQCSKAGVRLVFKNPDLQENEQGIIMASGGFFIQFQAVVPADREDLAKSIKRLGFSFLKHSDEVQGQPTLSCNESIQENMVGQGLGGGAYLLYYRSDFDPSDGFFVPLFTFLVADGEYGAAIHAYAENSPGACTNYGNPGCVEVARGWAKAIVDNCSDNPQNQLSWSSNGGCPADKASATCKTGPYSQARDGYVCDLDRIVPYPMILPGDGVQSNGVNGITVDFAELVQRDTIRLSLNGREIKDCTKAGAPPGDCWDEYESPRQFRDADLVPTNDQTLAGQECRSPGSNNPEGIGFVCARIKYGPGFSWEGTVNVGDVIRVEAKDNKGNRVTKTAAFGHATSGGVVFLVDPELVLDAPQGDSVEIRPGDLHEFNIRIVNVGQGEAHAAVNVNHTAQDPTFEAYWADAQGAPTDHVVIPPDGLEHFAKVIVKTKPDSVETFGSTPPHQLNATVTYDAGGVPVTKLINLYVKVSHEASPEHAHLHSLLEEEDQLKKQEQERLNATKAKGDKGLLPGPGLAAVVAAVALVLAVGARRKPE